MPSLSIILCCCVELSQALASTFQPDGAPFKAPVTLAPGFEASVIFSNLTTPRGIVFDSESNLLVVERGFGITAFSRTRSPSNGFKRTVVIANPNFTQGIQVDGEKLFASTAGQTLLFDYDPKTVSVNGIGNVIIDGIPPDGDLTTHTLQLSSRNTPLGEGIIIAVGPLRNIDVTARDPSSGRSQIRFFPLNTGKVHNFFDGKLIAYGIRNPAGFAFSPTSLSTLFVVENGASIDNVTGLTPTFVNDNPADELLRIDLLSTAVSYGFPDCTTLWNPEADPVGDPQYVNLPRGSQVSLLLELNRTDVWCRDPRNNQPPSLAFQAHSVPLDIKFHPRASYLGDNAFHAFVTFHGSFNRRPPTGYGVVQVSFSNGNPKSYGYIIQAANLVSCPGSCIRPVSIAFGIDGKLYVSSDSSGELFVIAGSKSP